eukprot:CAMPEP_0177707440 /NCGR_PEP_ID=MMETSP0484_2-20121128/9751_1 /TAXON_ID=354590 /ORGANISM="Rhodomonas lens, Strain RHODO" /LENGTH=44 /DNA_ID= /DNA_START= /DNA_END= /DNA_ORIENTATION=
MIRDGLVGRQNIQKSTQNRSVQGRSVGFKLVVGQVGGWLRRRLG